MTPATAEQPAPTAPNSAAGSVPGIEGLVGEDKVFFGDEKSLSPAMKQYAAFKKQYPGAVLFFRMGDFYEMFGEDARTVGAQLGLTVTSRGNKIPMAGVPFHQLDTYLRKAVAAGLRVAVCEQVQDPSEAKGVVARAVGQVVTPGTITDAGLLAEESTSAVACVHVNQGKAHAAVVELSTGAFVVESVATAGINDELARRGVTEVIVSESAAEIDTTGLPATPRPAWHFRTEDAKQVLCELYSVGSLRGFGFEDDDPALPAMGALVRYLQETQGTEANVEGTLTQEELDRLPRATLAHLARPKREPKDDRCSIDHSSLRSLEIERTVRGNDTEGSLLSIFLRGQHAPRSAMGKREIRDRLCRPLAKLGDIEARHDRVAALVEDRRLASELGRLLEGCYDIERINARLALGRALPRDLAGLGKSLAKAAPLGELLAPVPAFARSCASLQEAAEQLGTVARSVVEACVDDPPGHLREGGLFRDGYDAELDEARGLQRDAGAWLAEYQQRLIDEHELGGIKVGFNKVFGYYIELTTAQARSAPASFTRKQTLKNAERYITPELKEFEDKVLTAESRAIERERVLFAELCDRAKAVLAPANAYAKTVASLDAELCFASKAVARRWCKPQMTEDRVLEVDAGRHPVLDELLGADFVPNSSALGGAKPSLQLITGPNMAGKSTFIRQTALLAVLAQAGSFVPADSATLAVFDRVFTRVGADDALHRGQSTFMVEMTETASILNHATDRSLVVLDEIGRGTSTLDGLSLAWAIAERLAGETGPTPLAQFATHYHELTDLESSMDSRVGNVHVRVKEWTSPEGKSELVFTHRIEPGRAGGSYGVHVAQLAGLPKDVTERAAAILSELAVQHNAPAIPSPPAAQQMSLFTEYLPHPAIETLKQLDLDSMTPLQAFDALRALRDEAAQPSGEKP